jgi:hypothetical protein
LNLAAVDLQAQLIVFNLEAVDGAINAVRAALAQGLNWKELKRLIKAEREAGNPVANSIHSLQLEKNHITLQLNNMLDEEDGDEEAGARPATLVPARGSPPPPPTRVMEGGVCTPGAW